MVYGRSGRHIKLTFSVIVNLIVLCLLFAILEATARLIFPKEDKLGQILNVLEQDSELFWRQRANLNVRFQGVEVKTNFLGLRVESRKFEKAKSAFRIVCLGASPTFGWAVEYNDIYPHQLERMLVEKKGQNKALKVINAGVVGYTSYQGLILLKKEILKFQPDIITVSYVLNDIDRHRFYRSNGKSDKELNPKNAILIQLENFLGRSKFFRVWKKVVARARGARSKFSGIKGSNYLGYVRVSVQDYVSNLNSIVNIARENGIKLVLIKMPVNLPSAEELPEAQKHQADYYISRGLDSFKSNRIGLAIEEFKKAIAENPRSSRAFFYLGLCHEAKKEFALAQEYYQKAKDAQAFQCKEDSKIYNEVMEEVAKRTQTPLVDIVSAFAEHEGEDLYITPIHPNAAGHKIIAGEIYNALLKYKLLSNIQMKRRL